MSVKNQAGGDQGEAGGRCRSKLKSSFINGDCRQSSDTAVRLHNSRLRLEALASKYAYADHLITAVKFKV